MSAQNIEKLPQTTAGRSWMDIVDELFRRRLLQLPIAEAQRMISDLYGGRIAVPLPEIDAEERPAVANLIAQDIDQQAMRIASGPTSKVVYPLKGGSSRDAARARTQRRVLFEWDDTNQMDIFDGRRARWLVGFGQAPVVIRPNPVTRQPVWELRNPLGTYPSPQMQYDNMCPDDSIFTFIRTYQWLKNRHPQLDDVLQVAQQGRRKYRPDDRFELIEYVDKEVLVLGVLGSGVVPPLALLAQLGFVAIPLPDRGSGQTYAIELERTPNLTGYCPAIVPGRVTLDLPKGQTDDVVGIFQMQAKAMALYTNAVARDIYPNEWFIMDPNEPQADIITMADGLKGIVGVAKGGTIEVPSRAPGQQTMGLINSLERNARITGSAPAEWGGESPTNVRTAQRGLNVASNAVDFYIQEHQKVLGYAKSYEYQIAAAVDRAYFKSDKKSFYVAFGADKGEVTYKPGDLWQTVPKIRVRYNYAGMDANAIAVLNGQKLGEGTKSKWAVMQEDPSIEDVEEEQGRIIGEHLGDALLGAVQQQAQAGAITADDLATIQLLVSSGDYTLAEAVKEAQKQAQTRQANSGPPGTPQGPVAPGSPASQPGLQAGPAGAAQPTIAGPNPSQVNLKGLLAALAAGQPLQGQGGGQ